MMVMLIHYNIQNENKVISIIMQCKSLLQRLVTEIAPMQYLTFFFFAEALKV